MNVQLFECPSSDMVSCSLKTKVNDAIGVVKSCDSFQSRLYVAKKIFKKICYAI